MAISAAYGGPLFNMVIVLENFVFRFRFFHAVYFVKKNKQMQVFGLGLSVTFWNAKHFPRELQVSPPTSQTANSFLFLTIGLLMSLVVVSLCGFVIRKAYSVVLILLYLCATTFGLLAEFHLIQYPFVKKN